MKKLNRITRMLALFLLMAALAPISALAEAYDPPAFLSAAFSKESFDAGEPIHVIINGESGTNDIERVWVQIEHAETKRLFYSQNFTYSENGTDVSIDLPDEAPIGEYVVQAVILTDTAGVSTDTFRPGASFKLIGEPTDTDKPVLQNTSFDKEQYAPGDEVVLTVDATDQSGIDYVYASIQHLTSTDYTFRDFSTEVDGRYEIRYQLPENALNGEYGIQYLTIKDQAGNSIDVFNAEATFTISGGSTDVDPPTLNDISIEKLQYKPGEQVHITIDPEDESGVKKVYLYMRHKQTGVQYNAFATPNGDTFEFYRDLPVDAPLGEYEVFAVHLEDNLGNKTDLFQYEPRIEFDVIQ